MYVCSEFFKVERCLKVKHEFDDIFQTLCGKLRFFNEIVEVTRKRDRISKGDSISCYTGDIPNGICIHSGHIRTPKLGLLSARNLQLQNCRICLAKVLCCKSKYAYAYLSEIPVTQCRFFAPFFGAEQEKEF